LQEEDTGHVSHPDVAQPRAGGWLELVTSLAPADFDVSQDGVCIHRAGTVLYLCPAAPKLLGLDRAESAVGSALLELFPPADRVRVASALQSVEQSGSGPGVTVTLLNGSEHRNYAELTAIRADAASPPVDLLFVRARREAAPSEETESSMTSRDLPRKHTDPRRPTVLICDDEARLGELTARLLSEYGFAPLTVGTGEEALRVLETHEPAIDVVLLDVNLSGGQSAQEVLVEMQSREEPARVVLTSGLAEEDVDPNLVAHPSVAGYVPKPYGVEQLIQGIRRALSS